MKQLSELTKGITFLLAICFLRMDSASFGVTTVMYVSQQAMIFCFVLFCFVLFCFVLFCFVLFCFVLFCFVLFCFVLFCLAEQHLDTFDFCCEVNACIYINNLLLGEPNSHGLRKS